MTAGYTAGYTVRAGDFEGPLDLLLTLIEKRKLLINDISLAAVTDDYLEHLRARGELPLLEASHFVVVAATLLLIKSKSLLPGLALSEEEAEGIEDLERRLALYKRMKALARPLKERFGRAILFTGGFTRDGEAFFSPDVSLTLEKLHEAIGGILLNLPRKAAFKEAVIEKAVSLEEMIERLTSRIAESIRISFKEFSGGAGKRVDVIVGFLALLELVKRGTLSARQDELFGDISMESSSVGTPRYGA